MLESIESTFEELLDDVAAFFQALNWSEILLDVVVGVIATLLLVLAVKGVRRLFDALRRRLRLWEGTWIRSLRFQDQEFLSTRDVSQLLNTLVRVLHILALALFFSVYIQVVFSLIPWTKPWATSLFNYVLETFMSVVLAIINYLPDLVVAVVILAFAGYFVKFTRLVFKGIENKRITVPGFYSEWAKPTFNLARILIIAFAIVVVFPYLPGSDSPAFQGVSIFLGVLFSLGSTGAVANMVAGIVLTYMRAFEIGDRVKIAGTLGDVVEKTLLVTRLTTAKNVDITIPNSLVLSNQIINFSTLESEKGLILHTTVTIGYDMPWRKIHELLLTAASLTDSVESEPAPFVLQTSLDDFYVSYELNAYTSQSLQMPRIYSELHQNIQDQFFEAGVEIMSPHFSAIRDGNAVSIPEEHLPKDYNPPPFRVSPFENILPGLGIGKAKKT